MVTPPVHSSSLIMLFNKQEPSDRGSNLTRIRNVLRSEIRWQTLAAETWLASFLGRQEAEAALQGVLALNEARKEK